MPEAYRAPSLNGVGFTVSTRTVVAGNMCYGRLMATRIPLRELKNQCSAVVRRAEEGETFEVTVDGRLCARLTPANPPGPRTWVPTAEVIEMLEETSLAEAFAGERPDLGDALSEADDPFERYAGWLEG
jgi:prevent-host-death family protein